MKINNGKLIKIPKKSYKLKQGDEVIIESLERFVDGGILEEAKRIDLPIKYEKEDFVVVVKPKWVLSHPNSVRDLETPSVVAWAYHTYKDLPSIWNFIRAWLIHRLDKETDGLMILVKSEKWLAYFKELFQQKSLSETVAEKEKIPLKKFYKAISILTPQGKEFLDSITTPHLIQEDVIPKVPHSITKFWITKILWYEYQDNETVLIDIEILTGRTHQIRYHLSTYWLPILWDYIYGTEDDRGMLLTSYKLEFLDLYGESISLEV